MAKSRVVGAFAVFVLLWGCATPQPPGETPPPTSESARTQPQEAAPAPVPLARQPELVFVAVPQGGKLALHHFPARGSARSNAAPVLMLHPLSVPGAVAFNVKGYGWAQHLSDLGFDVWALDFRGFGRSSGAPIVVNSRHAIAPALRREDAMQDAQRALAEIAKRTHRRAVHVIGYEYGGLIGAMVAAKSPDAVASLVLVGASLSHKAPEPALRLTRQALETRPGVLDPAPPSYRTDSWEDSTLAQWTQMMRGRDLAETAALAGVREAFLWTDYAEQGDRNRIRRPVGPALDLLAARSGKGSVRPEAIRAWTLVVRGEQDLFADPQLARKLRNAKSREEVVVKNATHWLPYEREYTQLYAAVDRFLSRQGLFSISLSVRTCLSGCGARRGKRRVVIPHKRRRNAALRPERQVPFGLRPKTPAASLHSLSREWPLTASCAWQPAFLATTHPTR